MKPVLANFVVRPPVLQWATLTVTVAGVIVAAFQSYLALEYRRRALAAEEERRALSGSVAVQSAPTQASAPPYLQDALNTVRVASYDFGNVLTALETVRLPNIKVVSIEISTAEASSRVDVEFTEASALLLYLEELNAGLPETAGRWKMVRAQMPTPGIPGTATLLAPVDIGISDSTTQVHRR